MPVIVQSGSTTVVVDRQRTITATVSSGQAVEVEGGATVSAVVDAARTVSAGTVGVQGAQGLPGDTESRIASGAIGGHRLVRCTSATHVGYASNDDADHGDDTLGMTAEAAIDGAAIRVLKSGGLSLAGWAWTPGDPVYLGTNGLPTQTLPEAPAKFIQIIGYAEAADTVQLQLQPPIYLED